MTRPLKQELGPKSSERERSGTTSPTLQDEDEVVFLDDQGQPFSFARLEPVSEEDRRRLGFPFDVPDEFNDAEAEWMDGFTLTETLRHSLPLQRIPVVLVTSLSTDKDRARGLEVGANAYIVKSGFDRKSLLEAVGQLL